MKNIVSVTIFPVTLIIALCILVFASCKKTEQPVSSIYFESSNNTDETAEKEKYEIIMKRDLLCLMLAYPGYITGIEKDTSGKVYIVMKSGKRILYDDKIKKSSEQKLNSPDIQDMMEEIYPLNDISQLMDQDFNPGRIRVYSLLFEVYGSTQQQISQNLKNVSAAGITCRFNGNNNAAAELEAVLNELNLLMKQGKNIAPFLYPISGTFNYRLISGTERLSAHAFGIAIDLARDKRDYWQWATRKQGQSRLNEYSRDLVRTFENHGFIWGGKWGHFDILHFEYRPELIIKAKYFSSMPKPGENWFCGMEDISEETKGYIDMIESALSD